MSHPPQSRQVRSSIFLPQKQKLNRYYSPLQASSQTEPKSNPSYKEAIKQTTATVIAAASFALCLGYFEGYESFVEFSAGYLVEQSLSVDNLFVFLLLFEYFKVPSAYQNKVSGKCSEP